jgi:hypothetical protein
MLVFFLFSSLMIQIIFQDGFSLIVANNPFGITGQKIENINRTSIDGRLIVNLEYSPSQFKKGELTFFKVNLFDNVGDKQTRTRHVDCDLIISKDKTELFRTSTQYGEPFYHAINGVFLTSFPFNQTGKYTMSVEVAAINFVPIKPLFTNFTASVTPFSDENLKINLSA